MMIPTQTYGPTQKVEPKESKYIIGYTDKDGNDFIGICPDFNKEAWFNKLISDYGLERLCTEFPYQPLKVDKDSGMLITVFPCNYFAKATNCFHVLYHMRKDQMQSQNPLTANLVEQPSISIQSSNLIANSQNSPSQTPEYTPNWDSAYHHETEIPQIHDVQISNFIENEEDQKHKYTFQNKEGSMLPEGGLKVPTGWHPNQTPVNNPQNIPQYGSTYGTSSTQPNPYAYNPAYGMNNSSYLPQYRTTTGNYPFLSVLDEYAGGYDMFEEAAARRAETEQANMEYATRTNLFEKQNNPTMLDTSSNTVDFSNPESVAKMQGLYANPYYNNLNNPNLMFQGQPPQYSMSNPYGGVTNPLYSNYNTGYGGANNGWWNYGSTDLSFMDFSEEEIRLGKGFTVSTTRNPQKASKTVKPIKIHGKKEPMTVSLVRMVQITKNGKTVQMTKEEYDAQQKEEIHEEESDYHLDRSIKGRTKRLHPWYGEAYKDQVNKLAEEIAVYDEARALCLVGSLDDPSVTKHNFKLYYKACDDKLHWYKVQEEAHKDLDYRVPFRYRRTPVPKLGPDGKLLYEDYKIPEKRTFTFPNGYEIPFYEYDRFRDPDDDEWAEFYAQAEFIRDREIVMYQAKAIEEYELQQQELNKFNPYNPMDVRLHELKMEERMRQNQYNFFRDACGGSLSDEQFDRWWYQADPSSMPTNIRTEEDLIRQRKQWRHNMGLRHREILDTFQPLDHEKLRETRIQAINNAVRDFDKGTMEGCTSLKDFFDRLGYLGVRMCEENIAKQRAADINSALTVNRADYNRSLYNMANQPNWYSNQGVNDPYYQNRPHYMEFVNSQDYEENKKKFFDYCNTSTGTIPLRPIYK